MRLSASFCLLSVFSNNQYNFTTNQCEKCPSRKWHWDSNPGPLERDSSPMTTSAHPPKMTLLLVSEVNVLRNLPALVRTLGRTFSTEESYFILLSLNCKVSSTLAFSLKWGTIIFQFSTLTLAFFSRCNVTPLLREKHFYCLEKLYLNRGSHWHHRNQLFLKLRNLHSFVCDSSAAMMVNH